MVEAVARGAGQRRQQRAEPRRELLEEERADRRVLLPPACDMPSQARGAAVGSPYTQLPSSQRCSGSWGDVGGQRRGLCGVHSEGKVD